jgi:hypothetical protein
LFGYQHGERGADRTADDADRFAVQRVDPQVGVVAGPALVAGDPVRASQVADEVSVRIEDAHPGDFYVR